MDDQIDNPGCCRCIICWEEIPVAFFFFPVNPLSSGLNLITHSRSLLSMPLSAYFNFSPAFLFVTTLIILHAVILSQTSLFADGTTWVVTHRHFWLELTLAGLYGKTRADIPVPMFWTLWLKIAFALVDSRPWSGKLSIFNAYDNT